MDLSKLNKIKGAKSKGKRVGRGVGSGKGGHTTGLGQKGQKARSGNSIPFGFEGGQVPIYKKLPKLGGFRNKNAKDVIAITLERLNRFEDGAEVTPQSLIEARVLHRMPKHGVKILASGEITKKLTLIGFKTSEGAQKKLEKAGCKLKDNA